MRKKIEKPETLESALKEMIRMMREIHELEIQIDEAWGVTLSVFYIPGYECERSGEVNLRRGIEEIEKVFGQESKTETGVFSEDIKRLRHNGVIFSQCADSKTKTFVKAGKEPPKVVIVEE